MKSVISMVELMNHMENTEYRHSALIVKDIAGDMWLSDVGDSFSSSLKPLRMLDGVVQYPGNEAYLLRKRDDGSWIGCFLCS